MDILPGLDRPAFDLAARIEEVSCRFEDVDDALPLDQRVRRTRGLMTESKMLIEAARDLLKDMRGGQGRELKHSRDYSILLRAKGRLLRNITIATRELSALNRTQRQA